MFRLRVASETPQRSVDRLQICLVMALRSRSGGLGECWGRAGQSSGNQMVETHGEPDGGDASFDCQSAALARGNHTEAPGARGFARQHVRRARRALLSAPQLQRLALYGSLCPAKLEPFHSNGSVHLN